MSVNPKALLLDVDGVLVVPPKLFSEVYCEKYGVDPSVQQQFYATPEFKKSSIGEIDLIDALKMHRNLWQWDGDFEELIHAWFEAENHLNDDLVQLVRVLRAKRIPVYLATQQEKRRAKFIADVFADQVDGAYFSCDIGKSKDDEGFWQYVVSDLREKQLAKEPGEILFFDDRQPFVDVARFIGVDARLYRDISDVKNAVNL